MARSWDQEKDDEGDDDRRREAAHVENCLYWHELGVDIRVGDREVEERERPFIWLHVVKKAAESCDEHNNEPGPANVS